MNQKLTTHCLIVFLVAFAGCGPKTNVAAPEPKIQPMEVAAEPAPNQSDRDQSELDQSELAAKIPATENEAAPTAKVSPEVQYSGEAFRVAAHDGNIDVIRKALASGIDVNTPDPDRKYTALLMAAYNGHSQVVKVLLDNGASVDARDHEGKTPLMHAASGSFPDTVTMLIDAGANVNATETTEGFTALMTAAAMGEADVVRVLLDRGADPTVVDEDNDTAKDHAINAGKTDVAKMLP